MEDMIILAMCLFVVGLALHVALVFLDDSAALPGDGFDPGEPAGRPPVHGAAVARAASRR